MYRTRILCLVLALLVLPSAAVLAGTFGAWVDEMKAWTHQQNMKQSLGTLAKIFKDEQPTLAEKFLGRAESLELDALGGSTVGETMESLFGTDLAALDPAVAADVLQAAQKYYEKPPQAYYLSVSYVDQAGLIADLDGKMARYVVKNYETPRILPGYGGRKLPGAPFDPHTVHGMRSYIDERLTGKLIEDVCTRGIPVEVHANAITTETFRSLQERGYDHVYYVLRGYFCSPVVLMAGNPQTGDYRWVVTNLLGDDRLLYVLYQLRLAKHEGRMMDESQLSVVEHHPSIDRAQLYTNLYRVVLEAVPEMPDHIIIGWDGIIGDNLQDRWNWRLKHEKLTARLGAHPVQGLADALASSNAPEAVQAAVAKQAGLTMGELLATNSDGIFRSWKNCDYMKQFEKKCVAWRKKSPDAPIWADILEGKELAGAMAFDEMRAKWSVRTPFTGLSTISYTNSAGEEKVLLTTGFFYGEMADYFTAACLEAFGPKTVSYFGTSGGLGKENVADFNVCQHVVDRLGEGFDIDNAFTPLAKASGNDWFEYGCSVNVSSPLEESNARVAELRGYAGNGDAITVEVENVWIARALRQAPGVKLYMASGVSDIPGNAEEDITHINDNALRVRNRVRYDITDLMMGSEGWDIQSLRLRAKPEKLDGAFVQVGSVYNKNCSDGPASADLNFTAPVAPQPVADPDPADDSDDDDDSSKPGIGQKIKNWWKLHF